MSDDRKIETAVLIELVNILKNSPVLAELHDVEFDAVDIDAHAGHPCCVMAFNGTAFHLCLRKQ